MTFEAARTAAPHLPGIPQLSDGEFALFQRLIYQEAGISLSESKKALVMGRLSRRLRELRLPTFAAYFRRITDGDEDERRRMLDCICTNETHFFRDPRQFDFLEHKVIPGWIRESDAGRRNREIRVWSAGCSTGEEPYSLAMLLLRTLPPESGWNIEIWGTDLSGKALAAARAGRWPVEQAGEVPGRFLKAFMQRGVASQQGIMRAGPEIRSRIRFDRLNLVHGMAEARGTFDVIFCRNVMIYFDLETKRRVVHGLLDRLRPGGYLFLGHAESLSGISDRARSAGPTVYFVAGEASAHSKAGAR